MGNIIGRDGKEYSLEQLISMSVGENWSNDACKGYIAIAMRELHFRKKDISPILDSLDNVFDFISVSQAASYYRNNKY